MSQTVWVVSGTTESGDDWSLVFSSRPSDDQIRSHILRDDWLREEWEAGCIQGWSTCEWAVVDPGVLD